jgi:hypothetical protein
MLSNLLHPGAEEGNRIKFWVVWPLREYLSRRRLVALLVRVLDVATDIPPKFEAAAKPAATIPIVCPFDGLGKGLLEQRCVGACGDSGLVGKLLISIKALRHMSTDLANHP